MSDPLINYRVLAAALALDEFTVRDLRELTSAKEGTIRTVLHRERKFFTRVGWKSTGLPGGQPRRYAIVPDSRDELFAMIESTYQQLPARMAAARPPGRERDTLGALAAEDTLVRLYPQAKSDDDRRHLLTLVRKTIEGEHIQAGQSRRRGVDSDPHAPRDLTADRLDWVQSVANWLEAELDDAAAPGQDVDRLVASFREALISSLAVSITVPSPALEGLTQLILDSRAAAQAQCHSTPTDSALPAKDKRRLRVIFVEDNNRKPTRLDKRVLGFINAVPTFEPEPCVTDKELMSIGARLNGDPNVFVLTVDSDSRDTWNRYNKVVNVARRPSSICVFDRKSDHKFRNELIIKGTGYYPDASRMPKEVVASAVACSAVQSFAATDVSWFLNEGVSVSP